LYFKEQIGGMNMDAKLKEQLASLKFKENRFGGMEGICEGYHFKVTETPFNLVIIYDFLSKRTVIEPTEFKLPKNADLQMICKCIVGVIERKSSLEIYKTLGL
jgi:hypothetical protein